MPKPRAMPYDAERIEALGDEFHAIGELARQLSGQMRELHDFVAILEGQVAIDAGCAAARRLLHFLEFEIRERQTAAEKEKKRTALDAQITPRLRAPKKKKRP